MGETCKTCGGAGFVVVPVRHQECCQLAEFECGGAGCIGPRDSYHEEQDCCPACRILSPTEERGNG